MRDNAGLDEPSNLLAPVSDANVFDTGERCLAPKKVLQRLQADQDAVGGKVVMLADGLQQSFSDAWRLKARVARPGVECRCTPVLRRERKRVECRYHRV